MDERGHCPPPLPLDLSANMITLYVTPPGIIILIVRYMYYNIREYRAALHVHVCYIIKLCSMLHVHCTSYMYVQMLWWI